MYSDDTMGLGHRRRNLLIAQTLAHSLVQLVTLIITGVGEAGTFVRPPGVDWLALPALRKDLDGQYDSRSLPVSLQELITLRARVIRAALEAFEPDVLIVDNEPRGAVGELDPTLAYLRTRGRTRCVLGMREVLDDPIAVHREWSQAANEDAIRKYYDRVWVYGDPAVYDPVREYHFSPDVAAKVRYTGYLDQRTRLTFIETEGSDPLAALSLPPGQLVLCCVGGGEDGDRLAEAFAAAQLPPQTNGVLLMGPFMPREVQQRLRQRAATQPRLRVLEFVREPALLLQQADRVIAMGGYNTVCEILSFEKH
ncbi:MAG: glycosyltransferase, partial [Deltaproteobacteria bacterium]